MGGIDAHVFLAVGGDSGGHFIGRAEAGDAVVFDIDAGCVAVILGDGEMIVEADFEWSGAEVSGEIRFAGAVAKMPFSDGGSAVAFRFEQGRDGEAFWFNMQRRRGGQHFVFEGGAPTVSYGDEAIASGRTH